MVIDLEKIQSFREKNTAFFRFKKLDKETYLITNDIAKFSYLTKDEFGEFIAGNIKEGEKYDELAQKYFIKTENYEKKMSPLFAKKNQFLAYGPTLHIVVTTLRCNHKCQYCHAAVAPMSAKNMDMTMDVAKKVLDTVFFTSSPNLTIEFQWWESLVNWDIVKYMVGEAYIRWEYLEKHVTLALVTNLSLMDDDKMNFLIENNVHLSTSLDGNELVHNYNRTYTDGNSFEQVTYWIKRINEEYIKRNVRNSAGGYQKVGALLTVTKKTLPFYKEVIDTYIALWLDGIFLRPLNPYGFAAADIKNLWYSMDDFIEFYLKSMEYILECNKTGHGFREQLSSIYLSKILTEDDPNFLDERSPCGACIWQVAYNYDGRIYSCDEGRMLGRMGIDDFQMTDMTNDPEETYKNMMTSPTTKIMVQASTLDGLPGYNEDVYKPYIWVCPIHSFKTTGNIYPLYATDHKRKLGTAVLDYLFWKMRDPACKEIFEKWLGAEKNTVTSQCETV